MSIPAREQLFLAMRETAKSANSDEINLFLDLYLSTPPLTQQQIADKVQRNKNTITTWIKSLRAKVPHATIQEAARHHTGQAAPETAHTVRADMIKSVDAADIVVMLDQEIRKLNSIGDYKGKTKDLLDLFKFKREYQDLQVTSKQHDPERLLGPEGLAAMETVILERLSVIVEHRAELKTLWAGIQTIVTEAKATDEAR